LSQPAAGLLAEGMVLNSRYRLVRVLGSGGMASVWLAHDLILGREVAVKVMADTLAADPAWIRRFQRESRAAASLNHPNVVPVFDSGSDQGRPFLVMRHVAGPTLAEALRSNGPLDAGRLARELLGAVGHIHAAGLLHRDIKPSNVLLESDGRALLTDFGVATREDTTRLTQTGNVLGTARYLGPEVLAGDPASVRSDLFACGRLLEDVLAARPLPGLGDLIEALTAGDPARRPSSAQAALRMIDGTGASTTRVLPRAHRARPRARRPVGPAAARRRARTAATAVRLGRRSELARRRTPKAAPAIAIAIAIAIGLVIVIAVLSSGGGGGSRPPAHAPAPAPSDAPLGAQIEALSERVRYATRR
jgi:hypothetical protein